MDTDRRCGSQHNRKTHKRALLLLLWILLVTLTASNPGAAESLGPISEETPPAICDPGSFISGIRFTGSYCDNIKIFCTRIADAALGHGSWTAWFSEEERRRDCPPSHFIAGRPSMPRQLL
jgi:hypothetical protein